jgi:cystathionine beta-lyase/cystathionine gamma-synthase
VNVAEWAQQQADAIRDNISTQIDNFGAPTIYRVTQQINLRSDPSAASADTIITQLPAGTRIQQTGTPQADANGNTYEWIRVTVLDGDQGQTGWIALLPDRLEQE